ncbi:MAG: phosphoenolpyruvate--protein phosphotransferase [Phycisphaerales bacterium JB058]
MERFAGIGVSPGIVVGRVFVLDDEARRIPRRSVTPKDLDHQLARLGEAISESVEELERVRDQAERDMGREAAQIFGFHIGMLRDKVLRSSIEKVIQDEVVTAEYAVDKVFGEWADRFRAMPDSAFTTKVNDITDLAGRVLGHLVGAHGQELSDLENDAIVIARELTPSQTVGFDRSKVVAIATDLGGKTSHTAIVARALGIPAVVGLSRLWGKLSDGDTIILDGSRGIVIVEPDFDTIEHYLSEEVERGNYQMTLRELASLEPVTTDGTRIEVLGNIEFAEETRHVLEYGGEGIGLFRTEFLYLAGEREPTEEEHYEAYSSCVEQLEGRTLTIRTMDLGADKYTQAQSLNPERNPALGLRSIRYCLKNLPMFKRQLRAILRASAHGPVKLMLPLVTSVSEVRQARHIINDVMEDLQDEGQAFDRDLPIGIMVEVPSAALVASTLAREVDFFSIGTNDLVQYTLAVDRTNERVADLFAPSHPAVLKLVRDVVRAARRRDLPVSCCGEAAGDPDMAVLLMGLGVRTLSVTPGVAPGIKRLIRSISIDRCERLAKKAISFDSDTEVSMYVRDRLRKELPEAYESFGQFRGDKTGR